MTDKPPLRVLLVEDDDVDRMAVERLIRQKELPFLLTAVTTSKEAIQLARSEPFDLVLLDHNLPDGNGLDVLAELEGIPVVYVTGGGDESTAVRAMQSGAYDYLIKDSSGRYLEVLPSVVANVLERKAAEDALDEARRDLERRVEERTTELRKANERLAHEIVERKHAEIEARLHREELAHVDRINLAGEMAAGIAHQLNQPLAAIVNYVSGVARRKDQGPLDQDELLSVMERVEAEAQRAAQIIRHLRDLVKRREPLRAQIDVNELVRKTLNLAGAEARHMGVEIVLEFGDDLPKVEGDPIQLEQVLLNLMRNAIEAMQENVADKRILRIQTSVNEEGSVVVSVVDNGPGVSPETLRMAFDPFFTTKREGMGIGLTVCRTILEAHGGRLWASSNEGQGAVFHFSVPS